MNKNLLIATCALSLSVASANAWNWGDREQRNADGYIGVEHIIWANPSGSINGIKAKDLFGKGGQETDLVIGYYKPASYNNDWGGKYYARFGYNDEKYKEGNMALGAQAEFAFTKSLALTIGGAIGGAGQDNKNKIIDVDTLSSGNSQIRFDDSSYAFNAEVSLGLSYFVWNHLNLELGYVGRNNWTHVRYSEIDANGNDGLSYSQTKSNWSNGMKMNINYKF